jgi:hypothetical protein
MRSYPEDESDEKELQKLNAAPWMVELLKLNPEYTCWGPHEDYMAKGKDRGWESPSFLATWKEFRSTFGGLNDLNECVNFYFSVNRDSKECPTCSEWSGSGSRGYNRETAQISEDFYDFNGTGRRWCDRITEDEVDALIEAGRLGSRYNRETDKYEPTNPRPTAADVNHVNRMMRYSTDLHFGPHDAINRWILIETRAKRLGVYGLCSTCNGDGYVYTSPEAHVELVLWWLHPRKGCSKGIQISLVEKEDLSDVFSFLKEAADRNAERFARVVALAPKAG